MSLVVFLQFDSRFSKNTDNDVCGGLGETTFYIDDDSMTNEREGFIVCVFSMNVLPIKYVRAVMCNVFKKQLIGF